MDKNREIENLAKGQMEVEISRIINLPSGYNKDRIVAMVRDPWWIFAYWEITPQRESAVKEEIKTSGQSFEKSVLRIYDITGSESFKQSKAKNYFDIPLKDMARNWYVDVGAPARRWCIELGLMTKQGDFYALARSNIIDTPRFGVSDILDEAWMLSEEEYWWLFGASSGFDIGKSSLEMRKRFKKYLEEWISSKALFSFASHILHVKK